MSDTSETSVTTGGLSAGGSNGRSRRTVLRAAVAGAGAVAAVGAGATAAEAASRPARPVTFVLVHGAGSNSYGLATVVAELGLRGHRAVAVDLPGHGSGAYFPLSYQSPQDLERLRTEPPRWAG
ncbi:alpha/beta fold hydrolase [Streptomyces sp. NPDC090445]|uniref:alpha/beta fold hydrolase n=1 Tax=Streptomyces sp. NPDC090445 TaxID=3365963 RepID=UPI0037FE274D